MRLAARSLSTNHELERAIADAPFDEDRWIVLEDWLLEQDDPRGVIIQLEKAGRTDGAARVTRQLAPQLLGASHALVAPLLYRANWRAGYVRECIFTDGRPEALAALCAAPAAALMRRFVLASARSDVADALKTIGHGVFADTLHDLTLSRVHADPLFVMALSLDPLTRLRRLALRGAYFFDAVPRIEHLVVAPTSYDFHLLLRFAREAQFPDLTDLVLDFSNLAAPRVERGTFEALLAPTFAPSLARFEARAATDELRLQLAHAAADRPQVTVAQAPDTSRSAHR